MAARGNLSVLYDVVQAMGEVVLFRAVVLTVGRESLRKAAVGGSADEDCGGRRCRQASLGGRGCWLGIRFA